MARTALFLLLGTPFLLAAQPAGSWLLLEFGEVPMALLVMMGVMVIAASVGGILLGRKAARRAFSAPDGSRGAGHDELTPTVEADEEEESRESRHRGSWDFLAHPKVASNYDRWNQLMEQRAREARAQRAGVEVH